MIEAPHSAQPLPLLIRTALSAEAPAVAALHRRARATYYPDGLPEEGFDWTTAWREAVTRPDGVVLCAIRAGRLAGVASFRTPPDTPADTVKLFQFHVDPDNWRTGIGTALHAACVDHWRAETRTTAVLDVHVDNARAQHFYARQGWRPDPAHPLGEGDHHRFLRFAVPGRTGE